MNREPILFFISFGVPIGMLIVALLHDSIKRHLFIKKKRRLIKQIIEKVEQLTVSDIDVKTEEKEIDRTFKKVDKVVTNLNTKDNILRSVIQINMADDSCSCYFSDNDKIEVHCNLNNYLLTKSGYIHDTHIFEIEDDTGEIVRRLNADKENFRISIAVKYTVIRLNDTALVEIINQLEENVGFRTIYADFDYFCHEKDCIPDNNTFLNYIKECLLKHLQHDLKYVYR